MKTHILLFCICLVAATFAETNTVPQLNTSVRRIPFRRSTDAVDLKLTAEPDSSEDAQKVGLNKIIPPFPGNAGSSLIVSVLLSNQGVCSNMAFDVSGDRSNVDNLTVTIDLKGGCSGSISTNNLLIRVWPQ